MPDTERTATIAIAQDTTALDFSKIPPFVRDRLVARLARAQAAAQASAPFAGPALAADPVVAPDTASAG
jgi:hypothetical protein